MNQLHYSPNTWGTKEGGSAWASLWYVMTGFVLKLTLSLSLARSKHTF